MTVPRRVGGRARIDEPVAVRRGRGRFAGGLFLCGIVLALLALVVLPGWRVEGPALIVVLSVAALFGFLLYAFSAHLTLPLIHIAMVVGTICIAAVQALTDGGPGSVAAGLLYVWVAVFAALYYSAPAVAAHIGLVTVAQIAALLPSDPPALAAQVVVTTGTCVAAALVVAVPAGRLRRQVQTDPLTGVANRRGLESSLGMALATATRTGRPVAVALLDLDGFKRLNDERGHAAGDDILVRAVAAWQLCLRRTDTLARIGGDEFVVILPDCRRDSAQRIVGRLVTDTPSDVTCSAGVVMSTGDERPEALLARADAAMYAAKMAGGGRVNVDEQAA